MVVGPLFFFAELLSYVMRLACFSQFWTKVNKAVCPLHQLTPSFPESDWPIVQFCVTHYKENVSETYPTMKNLLEMDYPPHKLEINVLDDGYFGAEAIAHAPYCTHPYRDTYTPNHA